MCHDRKVADTLAWRALLLASLVWLCGCSPSRPDILLITVDTLRADRVSAYGHTRATTPVLDALAAEGVRFESAYSASSWTAPSLASLLTSLQPASHGVEHGHLAAGQALAADAVVKQEVIAEQVALWPELLAPAGYTSFGITANAHLDARFGFARGFFRYRCVGFEGLESVERVLEDFLEDLEGASPWFLWVHLLDPHAPYTPRPEWIRGQRPGFRGVPEPLASVRLESHYKDLGVERGTPAFELVNLLYEGEIAHTDAAIGRLLARLGLDGDELVFVTADHGESFLEHDRFGHGYNLYEEVVRVPLIVRMPGRTSAGRVVSQPVSGIDLLPTVLDALELEAPPALQGRSLLPLLRGEVVPPRDVVTSLSRFPPLESRSLRRGAWKYVHRYRDGRHALYDLEHDPGEQRNLLAERPEKALELAASLEVLAAEERAARVPPRLEPLSAEELSQLRALGYTQESGTPPPEGADR